MIRRTKQKLKKKFSETESFFDDLEPCTKVSLPMKMVTFEILDFSEWEVEPFLDFVAMVRQSNSLELLRNEILYLQARIQITIDNNSLSFIF